MTLTDMVKKFVAEAKAGKVAEAMETAAEFLKTSAGFYKLLFGGATASATTAEELAVAEADLNGLKADLLAGCSCEAKDGACKAVVAAESGPQFDPTPLILGLVDMLLKIIAERRKAK